MDCKYSFKDENNKYLNCKLTGQFCPLIRYCGDLGKFISVEKHKEICRYYIDAEDTEEQKNGTNKVRFEKDGFLFIELNDKDRQVRKFKNPYRYVPKYVNLIMIDGQYLIEDQLKKTTKKPRRGKK